MDIFEINTVITDYFNANWSYSPIVFENDKFEEETAYIRVSNLFGKVLDIEKGRTGVGERWCTTQVEIRVPSQEGTDRALDFAATIEGMFRRKLINGLDFDEPYSKPRGLEGIWYVYQTILPYVVFVGE